VKSEVLLRWKEKGRDPLSHRRQGAQSRHRLGEKKKKKGVARGRQLPARGREGVRKAAYHEKAIAGEWRPRLKTEGRRKVLFGQKTGGWTDKGSPPQGAEKEVVSAGPVHPRKGEKGRNPGHSTRKAKKRKRKVTGTPVPSQTATPPPRPQWDEKEPPAVSFGQEEKKQRY